MIRDIMTSNEEVTSNGREMPYCVRTPVMLQRDGSFDIVRFLNF